MLKDMKFQLALAGLIAAAVHFFVPDVDEKALVDMLVAVIAAIIGGHSIVQRVKK